VRIQTRLLMRRQAPLTTASSYPALRTASLCAFGAPASTLATKRVPTCHLQVNGAHPPGRASLTQTPTAPHMRFAARPRPSYTAPAPTTRIGPPVSCPAPSAARCDTSRDWLANRSLVSLHGVHAGRDEDGCGDVARVPATLTGLRADEVDAGLECLRDLWKKA
jgi:hypothetical protein